MSNFNRNINIYGVLMLLLYIIACIAIATKTILLKKDSAKWEKIQKEKTIRQRPYYTQRGNIYSYDVTRGKYLIVASDELRYDTYLDLGIGRVNAIGQPIKQDYIIPDSIWKKELTKFSTYLANAYPTRTVGEWKRYLQLNRRRKKRYTLLCPMITPKQREELKKNPIAKHLISVTKYKRIYPYGDLARRTIGIVVKDSLGNDTFNGIDGYYSNILAGSKGMRWERKIAPGLWVPLEDSVSIKPKAGDDIVTTIDIPLQELATTALLNCLDSNDAEEGTVILMETHTGYIKAIASFTRKDEHKYYEDRNIAVGSTYEPGSTFKTVTAMMLLDKGLIDTSFNVPTGMKEYPGATKPIYDVNKKGFDGEKSFARAMEISSNVGLSFAAYQFYGDNRQTRKQFQADLKNYFLYKKLDADILVREPMPRIRSSEYMDDLLRMSFGYVTQMTPLQLLTYYNGIANNGKIVKPIFVQNILRDHKVIDTIQPVVLKESMCKPTTLKKIQAILRGVVLHGTGRRLRSASYGIAGKSGTAEVNYSGDKIKSKYRLHRASFVGYFPYDNPQYSCIVVINMPKGGVTHGGDLAAPVFRELSDRVMGVNAQKTSTISQSSAFKADATNKPKNRYIDSKNKISKVLASDKIPDVRGWNLKDAVYVLEKLGLKVSFQGYGNVVSQSIIPDTKVTKNRKIVLSLQHK